MKNKYLLDVHDVIMPQERDPLTTFREDTYLTQYGVTTVDDLESCVIM